MPLLAHGACRSGINFQVMDSVVSTDELDFVNQSLTFLFQFDIQQGPLFNAKSLYNFRQGQDFSLTPELPGPLGIMCLCMQRPGLRYQADKQTSRVSS